MLLLTNTNGMMVLNVNVKSKCKSKKETNLLDYGHRSSLFTPVNPGNI